MCLKTKLMCVTWPHIYPICSSIVVMHEHESYMTRYKGWYNVGCQFKKIVSVSGSIQKTEDMHLGLPRCLSLHKSLPLVLPTIMTIKLLENSR